MKFWDFVLLMAIVMVVLLVLACALPHEKGMLAFFAALALLVLSPFVLIANMGWELWKMRCARLS